MGKRVLVVARDLLFRSKLAAVVDPQRDIDQYLARWGRRRGAHYGDGGAGDSGARVRIACEARGFAGRPRVRSDGRP